MRKIQIISIIFLIILAIILINSVSADDDIENKISIDGIEFNIPDDFKENETQRIINETNDNNSYITNSQTFINDEDYFIIKILRFSDFEVDEHFAESLADEEITINNITGFIIKNNNDYLFDYADGDKLIVINTNDKDVLEDILI